MKPCIHAPITLLAALLLLLASVATACGQGVDNAVYAELLRAHVREGLVDYAGFKRDEARLDAYLDLLAAANSSRLPRSEQFAYYLNAYNAWTIKLVLMYWPVQGIKDAKPWYVLSPWKWKFVKIDGETHSLDYIEHEVLRPRFKDPRVHFAVNCASMGCPRLHGAPFEGASLDATLDRLTAANINDPAFTFLTDRTLRVSRVFDWFGEDWGDTAAKLAFVRRFAGPELRAAMDAAGSGLELGFAEWDWSLNDASKAD